MQTLGYDPKLTDNDTHHPALRELEVFPENFAITALFPFLKTHGVNVPVASFNKPFRLQAGWVKVSASVTSGDENAKVSVVLFERRQAAASQRLKR